MSTATLESTSTGSSPNGRGNPTVDQPPPVTLAGTSSSMSNAKTGELAGLPFETTLASVPSASNATAAATKTQDSSRMQVAGLFESANSVNDILKEELFKSVVSSELNSLNFASALPAADDDGDRKSPPLPPALPTRTTSSSSSASFLQSMLDTLSKPTRKNGNGSALQSPTRNLYPGAPSAVGSGSNSSNMNTRRNTSTKPSPRDLSDLTSSRNWNNLGSHEDVDISDVFQTQQETFGTSTTSPTGATAAAAPTARKPQPSKSQKPKTDWNAVMQQGLVASTTAGAPVPVPRTTKAAAVPGVRLSVPPLPPPPRATAAAAVPERIGNGSGTVTTNTAPHSDKKMNTNQAEVTVHDQVYYEPTDNDVLLGRGGRANNHAGNKRYLALKDSIQARYMAADKNKKTDIAQELVDHVNKIWKGHFLKLDPDTNQWYEVDNLTARKRCSQALREINTAEKRAEKRARYSHK